MTEYDFSPGAYHAYQQKLMGVGNWAQEVSKHKPTNPFITPTDRDSDFYKKSKTGTRSKSSSNANNHRKAKSSTSHQRRGYQTDVVDSDSDSDDGGPDRPPTPTNGPSYGYSGPYGNPVLGPRYAPWPTNGGYISPPPVQYPQQQQQRPQQPIVISNVTGQRLVPTFNQQANAWEFRDPAASIRPPRSSRKSKRRGSSVPPGQGQMVSGVGGFIYPGQPTQTSQPMLSPPLSGPYGSNQPAMSAMYLPSGHTSPASIQYSLPQSAPNPQSMQMQQQQALQARYQQQQQQQRQQQQMRGSAPVIPIVAGISLPVMHMQGFAQKQQPMMSPPLNGMTTTYTGYPGPSTSPNTGYLSASNASITSGGGQPIASVILDSGKKKKDREREKEKEKEKEGSSFFGMLGRKKR